MIIIDTEKVPGCCRDGEKSEPVYQKEIKCYSIRRWCLLRFTFMCPTSPDEMYYAGPKGAPVGSTHVPVPSEEEANIQTVTFNGVAPAPADSFIAESRFSQFLKFMFRVVFVDEKTSLVNTDAYYTGDEKNTLDAKEVELAVVAGGSADKV